MTLAESVHKVIDLARKVRVYYECELPRWHPDYPLVHPHEGEPPGPPEEQELRDFLQSSSEEVLHVLLTLVFLGREDFAIKDLASNDEAIRRDWNQPEDGVSLLMNNFVLADELLDALEELREQGIDLDRMFANLKQFA